VLRRPSRHYVLFYRHLACVSTLFARPFQRPHSLCGLRPVVCITWCVGRVACMPFLCILYVYPITECCTIILLFDSTSVAMFRRPQFLDAGIPIQQPVVLRQRTIIVSDGSDWRHCSSYQSSITMESMR